MVFPRNIATPELRKSHNVIIELEKAVGIASDGCFQFEWDLKANDALPRKEAIKAASDLYESVHKAVIMLYPMTHDEFKRGLAEQEARFEEASRHTKQVFGERVSVLSRHGRGEIPLGTGGGGQEEQPGLK
jgi:hypothetical protein